MRKTNISRSAVCLFAAAALTTFGLASEATAQGEGASSASSAVKKRVDLNLENADIRHALKLLFNAAGVNYTIDPAVQGTVTVSLNDVQFRTALESLLKSVASRTAITYRVEDNVYHVAPRKEVAEAPEPAKEPEPQPEKRTRITKIHLNFIDPADLAQVLGGTVIQTRYGVNALMLGFGNGTGNAGQGQGGQGGFGQGQFGQGGFGQGGFGQGGFGQGGFGQGGFGQGGSGFGQGGSNQFGGGFGNGGFGQGQGGFGPGGGGGGRGGGRNRGIRP
jgi:hypothetical protein